MKIDTFNHIMPPAFIERLTSFAPGFIIKVLRSIPTMHDVDARLRHIEPFEDYQQIPDGGEPGDRRLGRPAGHARVGPPAQ